MAPTTKWLEWKEQGRCAYERGEYQQALKYYRTALRPEYNCPTQVDQAALWSNVVACRLQLVEYNFPGERKDLEEASAAVEDAKRCVQLHPTWAKGHLRLASAYIALGGHSNDACNELQLVLRIDPNHTTARQMLAQELRRDSAATATGDAHKRTNNNSSSNINNGAEMAVHDDWTIRERIGHIWDRVKEWYQRLNTDLKLFIFLSIFLVCLYVGFGGRFGWEESMVHPHYGAGNAYDEFRKTKYYNGYNRPNQYTHQTYNKNNHNGFDMAQESSQSNNKDNNNESHRGVVHNNNNEENNNNKKGYKKKEQHNGGFSHSYYQSYHGQTLPRQYYEDDELSGIAKLFDGSWQSILILAAIACFCHYIGIDPLTAIMVLFIIGGGGRRQYGQTYYHVNDGLSLKAFFIFFLLFLGFILVMVLFGQTSASRNAQFIV